jgi:hypothetical protein
MSFTQETTAETLWSRNTLHPSNSKDDISITIDESDRTESESDSENESESEEKTPVQFVPSFPPTRNENNDGATHNVSDQDTSYNQSIGDLPYQYVEGGTFFSNGNSQHSLTGSCVSQSSFMSSSNALSKNNILSSVSPSSTTAESSFIGTSSSLSTPEKSTETTLSRMIASATCFPPSFPDNDYKEEKTEKNTMGSFDDSGCIPIMFKAGNMVGTQHNHNYLPVLKTSPLPHVSVPMEKTEDTSSVTTVASGACPSFPHTNIWSLTNDGWQKFKDSSEMDLTREDEEEKDDKKYCRALSMSFSEKAQEHPEVSLEVPSSTPKTQLSFTTRFSSDKAQKTLPMQTTSFSLQTTTPTTSSSFFNSSSLGSHLYVNAPKSIKGKRRKKTSHSNNNSDSCNSENLEHQKKSRKKSRSNENEKSTSTTGNRRRESQNVNTAHITDDPSMVQIPPRKTGTNEEDKTESCQNILSDLLPDEGTHTLHNETLERAKGCFSSIQFSQKRSLQQNRQTDSTTDKKLPVTREKSGPNRTNDKKDLESLWVRFVEEKHCLSEIQQSCHKNEQEEAAWVHSMLKEGANFYKQEGGGKFVSVATHGIREHSNLRNAFKKAFQRLRRPLRTFAEENHLSPKEKSGVTQIFDFIRDKNEMAFKQAINNEKKDSGRCRGRRRKRLRR